jgi:orotate phosphoribosyltransferase
MGQPANGTMSERQRGFADALLGCGAVKFGTFRLKLHETQPEAPLSPIYLDLRMLQSFPDAMDAAVAALGEVIETAGLRFARYAGIPLAATALVAVLSHVTRVPMITPREAKSHGTADTINGAFTPGETVLAIDDVVSHAESKLEAIRVLEANGLVVRDVAVLVDREQGGPQQLAAAGYALHAAVRLRQLLDHWRATGGIDGATYARVAEYVRG